MYVDIFPHCLKKKKKKINNSTKGVDVISSSSLGLRHLQKLTESLANKSNQVLFHSRSFLTKGMYGLAYVTKKAPELLPCPGLERSRAGKNDRRRIKRLKETTKKCLLNPWTSIASSYQLGLRPVTPPSFELVSHPLRCCFFFCSIFC